MIIEIDNITKYLQPAQKLLGIDLGEKTIGLSVSDPALRVASPITTINRKKFTTDIVQIKEIVHTYNIGGIIFGYPLNMDGTKSKRCQSTKQFALNLGYEGLDIAMAFFDERLSTVAVERVLIDEADLSRDKRAKAVDKMASSFILQGALDYLDNLER
ncbi:MAG: Holliday junction resolvase RuvX [Alphaproteobacteria bacterium]